LGGGFVDEVFSVDAVAIGVGACHAAIDLIAVADRTSGIGAAAITGGSRRAGRARGLGGTTATRILSEGRLCNIAQGNRHDGGSEQFQMRRFRTLHVSPLLSYERTSIEALGCSRFKQNCTSASIQMADAVADDHFAYPAGQEIGVGLLATRARQAVVGAVDDAVRHGMGALEGSAVAH